MGWSVDAVGCEADDLVVTCAFTAPTGGGRGTLRGRPRGRLSLGSGAGSAGVAVSALWAAVIPVRSPEAAAPTFAAGTEEDDAIDASGINARSDGSIKSTAGRDEGGGTSGTGAFAAAVVFLLFAGRLSSVAAPADPSAGAGVPFVGPGVPLAGPGVPPAGPGVPLADPA